jgi:hypothetical protein
MNPQKTAENGCYSDVHQCIVCTHGIALLSKRKEVFLETQDI